jgi:hypothetical protein
VSGHWRRGIAAPHYQDGSDDEAERFGEQEGESRIKRNQMFFTFPDGPDRTTRTYQVVGMTPTKSDTDH